MTEACHGVTDMHEDTPRLLPCCIYCTRRQDARTSDAVLWVSHVVASRDGRWHCDQRLPAAALESRPEIWAM